MTFLSRQQNAAFFLSIGHHIWGNYSSQDEGRRVCVYIGRQEREGGRERRKKGWNEGRKVREERGGREDGKLRQGRREEEMEDEERRKEGKMNEGGRKGGVKGGRRGRYGSNEGAWEGR